MKNIVFREPKMSDLKSSLEMINSLVDEKAYITVQKKLNLNEERKYLKQVLKEIEKGTRVDLILDINGEVCGSARVSLIDKETKGHIGELGISLIKDVRGKGLGEKLLRKIIDKAHKELKIKIVTLYAYSKNKVAINLYKKVGFKKLGTIKNGINHYGKYVNNDMMVKYI
jgi:RimJ/RimL family protein N-acetyltransferase